MKVPRVRDRAFVKDGFIRAMGGKLEINAIFPEGKIKITQFHTLTQPDP